MGASASSFNIRVDLWWRTNIFFSFIFFPVLKAPVLPRLSSVLHMSSITFPSLLCSPES